MYSIEKNIENTTEIRKSKFICKLYKINNQSEIKNILNELKKEYKDSTHICYAYILNGQEKCSDDGEPNGTAGSPILNLLKKKKLDYILAVVIRYFGGIKLGVGGLVRAYTNTVAETIRLTNIKKLIEVYLIEFEFDYNHIKLVDYMLIDKKIISKNFNNNITYNFYLKKEELNFIPELEKIATHISIKDKVLIIKD